VMLIVAIEKRDKRPCVDKRALHRP